MKLCVEAVHNANPQRPERWFLRVESCHGTGSVGGSVARSYVDTDEQVGPTLVAMMATVQRHEAERHTALAAPLESVADPDAPVYTIDEVLDALTGLDGYAGPA